METYTVTRLFHGDPQRQELRRFGGAARLAKWMTEVCGQGWGVRVSITDQQARRLGVYESPYGEMLLPVAGDEPISVSVTLAPSIQAAGGRARAKSMSKRALSAAARKAAQARWKKRR